LAASRSLTGPMAHAHPSRAGRRPETRCPSDPPGVHKNVTRRRGKIGGHPD
jgi:hypothetical protein